MRQKLFKVCTEYFSSLPLHRLRRLLPLFFVLCMSKPSAGAVIDVTAYGAIPNDWVDDTPAIQNAIDAASDNSTIYFPRGTYLLAGINIDHRTGLTLSGDGSTLTILKRNGSYPNMFESSGSTDMLVTKLGFDANGITAFGGFLFYEAKRITITKNHFFDSTKRPVGDYDRYAWVFGRGSVPSEDIFIKDNLIEDLQLEVDFGLRVVIEGNTVIRPVATAGIGVFTINDNTSAQDYTIQNNTIVDPVVSGGGIVVHLDPPNSSYSTMRKFRILDNYIVYTKSINSDHASAIRLGTGDNSQTTAANVFDDIVIQNNITYKDPGNSYDFWEPVIFGNSSAIANFKFDNTNVSNNLIYYNNRFAMPTIQIREPGVNYLERNNVTYAISSDTMPPSVPTALTTTYISENQIHLAWNPSVDNIAVYRYRIYRNGLAHSYSATTSYADQNLTPGIAYTYTVAAVDVNGKESSQSYSVVARTTSSSSPSGVVSEGGGTLTTISTPNTMSGTGSPTGAVAIPPGPTLVVTEASIPAGGTLTGTWNRIASPTSTDWIALYTSGAANTSYIEWIYTSCSKSPGNGPASGSCAFAVPRSIPQGSYELRLLGNDGFTALTLSNRFTVTADDGKGVTLTVSSTTIPAGATLTALWTGVASPTSTDWIGLYEPGFPNTSYIDWIYVSCSKDAGNARISGTCPFVIPASLPAGSYELRLFGNNGYSKLAGTNGFSVGFGQVFLP